MREDRTTRPAHWYDQPAGGMEMWGTVWRLKPEYAFRDWRPPVTVGIVGLIGIILMAWLAHPTEVVIYFLVLADLALAGIIWNTSRRQSERSFLPSPDDHAVSSQKGQLPS